MVLYLKTLAVIFAVIFTDSFAFILAVIFDVTRDTISTLFYVLLRETFNLPIIEEVKWNSCKVNASSFAALLNEQNLEFTIQAPQLVDISNSQQPSVSQLSTSVAQYMAEECRINVVQPPVRQNLHQLLHLHLQTHPKHHESLTI
nr:uncharacterized protein LOC124814054 [Hydra vulgaris]